MKKLALFTAVLLCLSLAACSKDTGAASQSSSAVTSASASEDPAQFTIPDPVLPTQPVTLKQFASPTGPVVTMKTTMGDIELMLFPEEAPKTVENFITHAKNGYYDGLLFHRVIKDFMLQGGDPVGNGTGGESIWGSAFEDEFSDTLYNFRGALSMANSGTNTNGSQFFIVQAGVAAGAQQDPLTGYDATHYGNFLVPQALQRIEEQKATLSESQHAAYIEAEQLKLNSQLMDPVPVAYTSYLQPVLDKYREVGGTAWLDGKHTVFGQVTSGMEIVDAIAAVAVNGDSKPLEDVKIISITVKE